MKIIKNRKNQNKLVKKRIKKKKIVYKLWKTIFKNFKIKKIK